jgi:hypothetical protein
MKRPLKKQDLIHLVGALLALLPCCRSALAGSLEADFAQPPPHFQTLVNYLDPEAARKFIALTYEKYYAQFPMHFGSTIDRAF